MTSSRHVAAFVLLASVVLGALVAPLSHFAYMVVSERFQTPLQRASASHMGHEAIPVDVTDGIGDATNCYEECTFAAFVMNQAQACAVVPSSAAVPGSHSTLLSCFDESSVSAVVATERARGPPAVSRTIV